MRTIGIVTPWIDHRELAPAYAAAVARADDVVVIDNGGAPVSAELGAHVITARAAPPMGFAESNNLGAAMLSTDIVVFLNNDVHGDPYWIDQAREQIEDGALYGPSIGTQTVQGIRVPYVEGWCVAATHETWHELSTLDAIYGPDGPVSVRERGPWDAERFPKPYWEDVELSLRAVQRGLELRRAPWPIHHLGGTSTATVPGAWDGFEAQRQVVEQIVAEMTGATR